MRQMRFTGLWGNADFMRLWIGQTTSVLGSVIGIAAMGFTAIQYLHATPFQLGLLSAARLAPGFLAALFAGAWVDRIRRRPILIGADLGRAVLLATLPLAAFLGVLRFGQLCAVVFLVSILTAFFDVAYRSYLPSLISRDDLLEGNSKLSATASLAEVSGFGVAGWLVQLFAAPLTILLDAVSFAVSAASVWLIRVPEQPGLPVAQPNMRREIAEGLRVVLHHPILRALAACTLSKEFFGGMFGPLVLLYLVRDVGFSPGVLGSIFAVGGVSSLLGAMGVVPLARRYGRGPSMIIGFLLFSGALFLIPMAQGPTLLGAALLVLQQMAGDGAATVYNVNLVSLRQESAPELLLGRVNASSEFLTLGAGLAGSLASGVAGELIGVRTTLFIGAAGTLFSALLLIGSPIRRLTAERVR